MVAGYLEGSGLGGDDDSDGQRNRGRGLWGKKSDIGCELKAVWDLVAQAAEAEEGAGFRAETCKGWPDRSDVARWVSCSGARHPINAQSLR